MNEGKNEIAPALHEGVMDPGVDLPQTEPGGLNQGDLPLRGEPCLVTSVVIMIGHTPGIEGLRPGMLPNTPQCLGQLLLTGPTSAGWRGYSRAGAGVRKLLLLFPTKSSSGVNPEPML